MSKQKKEAAPTDNDEFEAALQSKVVTHSFTAPTLGIVKCEAGGFDVVKVLVDPANAVANTNVEVLSHAENKWEANEMFKIQAIKLGIL